MMKVPLEGFLMTGRDLSKVKLVECFGNGKPIFEGNVTELPEKMDELNLSNAFVYGWFMDGNVCEISIHRE